MESVTARNAIERTKDEERGGGGGRTDLLVEMLVLLVDVGNISFVFVLSDSRSFLSFVETTPRRQYDTEERRENAGLTRC